MLNGRNGFVRKCVLALFVAAAVPLFLSAVGCACCKKGAPEEKPKAAAPAPEHPKAEHPK